MLVNYLQYKPFYFPSPLKETKHRSICIIFVSEETCKFSKVIRNSKHKIPTQGKFMDIEDTMAHLDASYVCKGGDQHEGGYWDQRDGHHKPAKCDGPGRIHVVIELDRLVINRVKHNDGLSKNTVKTYNNDRVRINRCKGAHEGTVTNY